MLSEKYINLHYACESCSQGKQKEILMIHRNSAIEVIYTRAAVMIHYKHNIVRAFVITFTRKCIILPEKIYKSVLNFELQYKIRK